MSRRRRTQQCCSDVIPSLQMDQSDCSEFGGTNFLIANKQQSVGNYSWYKNKVMMVMIAMMLFMTIGAVDGFSSSDSGHRLFLSSSPLVTNVRSSFTASNDDNGGAVVMVTGRRGAMQVAGIPSLSYTVIFSSISSSTALHLSSNNNNNKDSSSSSDDDDLNEDSLKALQLIQQWLLLHLPSLNNDDLKMYSMQLLEDGFDSVERLEGVNNGGSGLRNSSGGGRGSSNTSRLEDLYFMKKGHRRVLLQKIGKVREMKENAKNRLRIL
eukprot:scaffold5464_cov97-Skeletonema_dohrnii-CCMP3373.AAC.4